MSPLLAPLGSNHSAGRVQSAALHLVVERESARERFTPEDYWTLTARYRNGLAAKYAVIDAEGSLVETKFKSEDEATRVKARASLPHVVETVEKKPVERRAPPPFTTSSLQQAAGKKLRFSIDRTMEIAQSLFESGRISYHRTDSVNLSDDAVAMARTFIEKDFPQGLPTTANVFRSKAGAQEAHEAIRPTSLDVTAPDGLSPDQAQLYDLIRCRFLACQCKPLVLAQTTVVIRSGDTTWRARGSVTQFEGWTHYAVHEAEAGEHGLELPKVTVGEVLDLVAIDVEAKQTKPPPRFTLLSLADEMERTKIGRPSTVPTIAGSKGVLLKRRYIVEDAKKFIAPTDRGRAVDALLSECFGSLVEVSYTSSMEERLDEIAEGKVSYKGELRQWWSDFSRLLPGAEVAIAAKLKSNPQWRESAPDEANATGKQCPCCGRELLLRHGRRGAFLSCSGWSGSPKCDYTVDPSNRPSRKLCMRCGGSTQEGKGEGGPYVRCADKSCGYWGHPEARASLTPCPKCGMSMEDTVGKHGPYSRCLAKGCDGRVKRTVVAAEPCPACGAAMHHRGEFLSCSRYPDCKGSWDVQSLERAKKSGRKCPRCKTRLLREVKSSKGAFVGCSGFPICKHIEKRDDRARRQRRGAAA